MEKPFVEHVVGELLTPEAFQAELIIVFERYRTGCKPESLQTKAELPPIAPAKYVFEETKQSPGKAVSSLWGRLTATVINTASDLSENMATHNALTKFIESQMMYIIYKRCSSLKKMTDLAILFHGLLLYISDYTHSVKLLALLTEFNDKLWSGTPLDARGEKKDLKAFKQRFSQQIGNAMFLCENKGFSSEHERWEQIYECAEAGEAGLVLKSTRARASVTVVWPAAWMGDTYAAFLGNARGHYNVGGNSNNSVVSPASLLSAESARRLREMNRITVEQDERSMIHNASRSLERFAALDPEIEAEYKRIRDLYEQALRELDHSHHENRAWREVLAEAKGLLNAFNDEKFLVEQAPAARVIISNVRGLLNAAPELEASNKLDL